MNKSAEKPLLSKEVVFALRKFKWWEFPLRLSAILFVYVLCALLVTASSASYSAIVLWPFMGFILSGFLNASHDCIHCTHVKGKRFNRVVGRLWCLPILMNFSIYRYQHLIHHKCTGVSGDTEPPKKFNSIGEYLYALSGLGYWVYVAGLIIKTMRKDFLPSINTKKRQREVSLDNLLLLLWIILMLGLTVSHPRAMLIVYWGPLFFYAPAITVTSLTEHYGCASGKDTRRNTRSMTSNFLVRFILWNANYHAEHHAYPSIPAVNMKLLHKKLPENFYQNEKSYVLFHYSLFKGLLKKRKLASSGKGEQR